MNTAPHLPPLGGVFAFVLLFVSSPVAFATGPATAPALPRFSEEREAAALFFVKKNAPDIVPLLEQLKKSNEAEYQREIREIFQVTEYLAELQDDPRRHDLELKIWKTENRVYALVAKLSSLSDDDRKKAEASIHGLARELVDLDIRVLELKSDQLSKELADVKDELAKARDQIDKQTQSRYEALLDQAKKRKKA
jgi:hypothetical protein